MKKLIIIFLLFGVFSILSVSSVYADLGPKPSSTFIIKNAPDVDYYFDLFIPKQSELTSLQDEDWNEVTSSYYRDDFPRFVEGIVDDDDFVSFTLYTSIPHHLINEGVDEEGNQVFKTGYISCPTTFKVVFYTTDEVILSTEILTKTFFYAEYVIDFDHISFTEYDLEDQQIIESEHEPYTPTTLVSIPSASVSEHFPVLNMIVNFAFRLILTISLEIFVLFLFLYKNKSSYLVVLYANILTQTIFTFSLLLLYYVIGNIYDYLYMLLILETLVFIGEILIYRKYFVEWTKKRALIYAVAANLATLLITFLIPIY